MRYISVYAGDILQGSDFAFPISSNVPTIPEPTKWVARRAKRRMARSGNCCVTCSATIPIYDRLSFKI